MMKKLLPPFLLILLIGLGWAAFATTANSAPNTIPVTDADAVFEPTLPTESGFSATLRTLIDGLPDRLFLVRSPDGIFWITLETLPATLSTLMDEIPDAYFPVRSGDGVFWQVLSTPSATLNTLLGQIPDAYIPVRSADGVFMTSTFQYPSELTADHRPPIISNVEIEPITGLVEWDTDEFASSEARFGNESGVYTEVISSTLWKTHHQLIPTIGGWSFILLRAEDRSGNVSEYYYPGFSISGAVLDDGGDPIEGAAIWVEPVVVTTQNIQAGEITLVTLTDASGVYSLSGVPEGEYTIYIHHPDFAFDGQGFVINVNQNFSGIDFEGEADENLIYLPLTIK